MEPERVRELIQQGETLEVEFKRGKRNQFNDNELVEAVVCLANGPGGALLIGVEDDGTVTGAEPRHGSSTDPLRIDALIAGKTTPFLQARTSVVELDGHEIIVVEVPRSQNVIGTNAGLYVRRALKADGTPQCVPFHAHEMLATNINRGAIDFAALPARESTMDDLDPLEFERFRAMARKANADVALASLSDLDICRALGVVSAIPDRESQPTLGALLLFGREEALRRHIPNHEAAFQVLDGLAVETNDFMRAPLFKTAEDLLARVAARNHEEELQMGLIRVSVPMIPEIVARESIANALVHRDYTALGPVRVEIGEDSFKVSSPGGFPPGVELDNLLDVTQPRSPILADAFKRAGIVERTGRGINQMYASLLRLGRDAPDYSSSTQSSVTAIIPLGSADLPIARFVIQQEEITGKPMPLVDLQILHLLRSETRLTNGEIAQGIGRTDTESRAALTRMIKQGLVEARGTGKGRSYHLSAAVYRVTDNPPAYVRVKGTEPIQQEHMVHQYVEAYGVITRREAAELCMITPVQASTLLRRMASNGELVMVGERRGAKYIRPSAGEL